jgi:hypothetical protein
MLSKSLTKKSATRFVLYLMLVFFGFFISQKSIHTRIIYKAKHYLFSIGSSDVDKGTVIIPPIDSLYITISREGITDLKEQEKRYQKFGFITASSKDYVKIEHIVSGQKKTIKGKVRFKGDLLNHINSDKQSFRVKLKKKSFRGMKTFSITHPKARNYIHEYIYHKMMKDAGLIHLNYGFANVNINDSVSGVFAIEPHFDKSTLTYNNKDNGMIFKLDDYAFFEELKTQMWSKNRGKKQNGSYSYYTCNMVPYGEKNILQSDSLKAHLERATYLIEEFKQGNLSTSEVFDIKKLARYFAILDVTGCHHSSSTNNIRLYYDFTSEKLEPIGFDGNGDNIDSTWLFQNDGEQIDHLSAYQANVKLRVIDEPYFFTRNFFKDNALYKHYIGYLTAYSDSSFLNDFFDRHKTEFDSIQQIIRVDYPEYNYSTRSYYLNQSYVRSVLNSAKEVNGFVLEVKNEIVAIEVGNVCQLPVEIINIIVNGTKFSVSEKTILAPKVQFRPVKYGILRRKVESKNKINTSEIFVQYKILGTKKLRKQKINGWSKSNSDFN